MRQRAFLLLTFAGALLLRLTTWSRTFANGRVYIDGPDGYLHVQRAWEAVNNWPFVPRVERWINWPLGGIVSHWAPLFDGLLATIAWPWHTKSAVATAGALSVAVIGVFQIAVLFALVRHLASARAALIACAFAAVLPGVVRYTMAGALDHDPFIELALLVALYGVATGRARYVALGLSAALLTWAGSIIEIAVLVAIVIATRSAPAARAVMIGCVVAAIAILPLALTDPWHHATFEGLTLLQVTAAAGAAFVASLFSRSPRFVSIALGVVTLPLLPWTAGPFIRGVLYTAGDAPILPLVAEARPLLTLLGTFDVRPMLVRFGLLTLIAAVAVAIWIARRRTFSHLFLAAWVVVFLTIAMLHSRFSYDAAIALCAAASIAIDEWFPSRRAAMFACAVALLPALPAYIQIAGFEPFNFYARPDALRETEMDSICDALRTRHARAGDGVLAPWSFGHWIVWIAEKPVVLSPMLSVGQSEFAGGIGWQFLADAPAREFLRSHRVGFVIVTPEPKSTVVTQARAAGLDPEIALRDYQNSVAARLTFGSGAPGYREILRSRASVGGPFGPTPLVRVYEVE